MNFTKRTFDGFENTTLVEKQCAGLCGWSHINY